MTVDEFERPAVLEGGRAICEAPEPDEGGPRGQLWELMDDPVSKSVFTFSRAVADHLDRYLPVRKSVDFVEGRITFLLFLGRHPDLRCFWLTDSERTFAADLHYRQPAGGFPPWRLMQWLAVELGVEPTAVELAGDPGEAVLRLGPDFYGKWNNPFGLIQRGLLKVDRCLKDTVIRAELNRWARPDAETS